ncbi:MAG: hypothetical protein IJX63_16065 [Lachnospiraceae bacterium]|nr:hypothetical protein [Lachnospiraceae bacterium]
MKQEYIDRIADAECVLVGIGSEFEKNKLQREARAIEALQRLGNVLKGKNYFIITTCTNSILNCGIFDSERIVSPCGTIEKKQCPKQCENSLQLLTEKELEQVQLGMGIELGRCSCCGEKMVLNNVYTDKYDETGYLEDWGRYTKWLQGTLNKKLCILELGVDLVFPSIIRWPFEKVGFYNQKAIFIRVNERLYYLSEELKDKGIAIGQNAIDWLLDKEI